MDRGDPEDGNKYKALIRGMGRIRKSTHTGVRETRCAHNKTIQYKTKQAPRTHGTAIGKTDFTADRTFTVFSRSCC